MIYNNKYPCSYCKITAFNTGISTCKRIKTHFKKLALNCDIYCFIIFPRTTAKNESPTTGSSTKARDLVTPSSTRDPNIPAGNTELMLYCIIYLLQHSKRSMLRSLRFMSVRTPVKIHWWIIDYGFWKSKCMAFKWIIKYFLLLWCMVIKGTCYFKYQYQYISIYLY